MLKIPALLVAVAVLPGCVQSTTSQSMASTEQTSQRAGQEEVVLGLSRDKWLWMADRNMSELEALFHPSARFVHMGATMDREAELNVVRGGQIQYKRADVSETSVEMIRDTAIVYSRLRLLAVVGGNEVTNPFSVTEVYVWTGGRWQLASMAFTRLLGD
jgi:hypothetical protein